MPAKSDHELNSEVRRKFFYAMSAARMYDQTIELVVPSYRLVHQDLQRLATEHLMRGKEETMMAVDIGSGTGAEAIPLLRAIPSLNLTAVDLCEPMHTLCRTNAAAKNGSPSGPLERLHFCIGDILSHKTQQDLKARVSHAGGFSLAVSAFTVHHFTKEEKGELFGRVFSLLRPGGVFLLADLFNFEGESSRLTQTIGRWETDWIRDNFEARARKLEGEGDTAKAALARRMGKRWLRHYQNDNILGSVSDQCRQLAAAGFSEIGNPFRYWQVGLVYASKSR